MMLGNLSTANEHEARKSKKSNKKKKSKKSGAGKVDDDAEEEVEPSIPEELKRKPVESRGPVRYKANDEIPRNVLFDFLTTTTRAMQHPQNIQEIISDANRRGIGLHTAAVDFQTDFLEFNYQVERVYGCQYLAQIPRKHPNDYELIEAAKNFMLGSMRSYMKVIDRRAEMFTTKELPMPDRSKPMPRHTIMEFLECCVAKMSMPDTKAELRSIFEATKQPPNERVIEMQREVFPLLGYEAAFGVDCLNRVQMTFSTDRELYAKFTGFASSAEFAVDEATWTTAQRAKFFDEVPPLMYHHPHIFMLQQREAARKNAANQQAASMTREQAEESAAATMAGGAESAMKQGGRLDANALRASGMLSFLTTPEGRGKLAGLAEKVKSSKERLTPVVTAWSQQQKKEVFESFGNNETMRMMAEMGDDPGQKMLLLMDLQQEQLDQMMTLMLVLSFEDSSDLLEQMRESIVSAHMGSDPSGKGALLNHIISTLGSLSKFGSQQEALKQQPAAAPTTATSQPVASQAAPVVSAAAADHHSSHDHSHSHGHGHSCEHDHGPSPSAHNSASNSVRGSSSDHHRDIASGRGEAMDR